jgi:ribokinase
LLQLEIARGAVAAAAPEAHRKGVTTILDRPPAAETPAALYQSIDYLTPNEVEASILTGNPVQTFEDAGGAARILQARGVPNVIIKMGGKGVFWRSAHGEEGSLPAFAVKAVDTVAAGDAFNGAFAAALSEGKGFLEALRWGMAGGAVSTTREGAQPSMPDRSELLALLNR